MATRDLSLRGDRKLTIASTGAVAGHAISPPFVTLLPAFSAIDRKQAAGSTKELISLGCVEFCCVGPNAELLHDDLDAIIEEEGALDVVTTWIEDLTEASEYFLRAAAGGRTNLLALIRSHPELQLIMEREVRRDDQREPSN